MQWQEIARGYENQWNYPHCIGALGGKHVTVRAPQHSGSYFFNYKGFHSIVLLALVDSNYMFIFVDIGCNGRVSDGGVFSETPLAKSLLKNKLSLPISKPLAGRRKAVPYVIVADDAFPLQNNIMKPYPYKDADILRRIFNYRLSRARRTVESAFGILATRFRVLLKPMNLNPDKAQLVVQASVVLHNFLMKRDAPVYAPPGTVDKEDQFGNVTRGSWHDEYSPSETLNNLSLQGSNHNSSSAREIQKEFAEYFGSLNGEVPWQYKKI